MKLKTSSKTNSQTSTPGSAKTGSAGWQGGLVVAGFGRHVLVETASGQRLICHPRGKKNQALVGDKVHWLASADEGTIEKIKARRNTFYRQDELRTKSFAANLDQVLIFMAAEPEFSENQLTRALIAAEAEHIKPVIALNKSDLAIPFERAWAKLAPYRHMGYEMLRLAIKPADADVTSSPVDSKGEQFAQLQALFENKTTLVLGPSGAGKSSLINLLVPQAQVLTAEISQALQAGKHTTTSTTLYWLNAQKTSALMDSPGFQEFGLNHIEPMELANLMPDIKAHAQNCRFYNCSHLHEPGCGVILEAKKPAGAGSISTSRYRLYSELFAELSQPERY